MRNRRLITPKYARIVVRIADRERISLARARTLYRRAVGLGIRDYSRGLPGRVAKAVRKARAPRRDLYGDPPLSALLRRDG